MSNALFAHSPDLAQLRNEGYEVSVRRGYVIVANVPYRAPDGLVKRGTLCCPLKVAGDRTAQPEPHTAFLAGEWPHDATGEPFNIATPSEQTYFEGLTVNYQLSSKPDGLYANYYDQLSSYANILSGPAAALDPTATAKTFGPVEDIENETPFLYFDTASARAGILGATEKLSANKIAIIGLGGTGSYVLDLVAKTPVKEIHLYDGDCFLTHNAFRAPSAASLEELRSSDFKVDYFARLYSKMRRGVVPHADRLTASNVGELAGADFVFICMDAGPDLKAVIEFLLSQRIPFVTVGMGIELMDDTLSLEGMIRVTTATAQKSDHLGRRVATAIDEAPNDYDANIQIVELNALNAALAVIKWKKLAGFYADTKAEHHCVYTIDGNHLLNDDRV